ncbi:PAM68 family protein [Cyanobium sp. Morenito 9A2]|uniref:PAM68 family protein n=1 Tax=Cyanobium sp. Morenito 9A2 TaxID=2823718 RepID=UPI0020CD2F9B|nr:PAM68 family protein [Cyanobium sp. Morenito 9A2]MCP9850480.1 PAM68 family protein [Cyanobium sp. Morenito 9A2]
MGRQRSKQGGGAAPSGNKASRSAQASSVKTAFGRSVSTEAGPPSPVQGIPAVVAQRMVRRIALATGLPTTLGMGVFVVSYMLVSKGLLDIPPGLTLVSSGGLFLLGLVGLSYGVFSASWEEAPGSLLGFEQINVNLARLRSSGRA